MVVLTLQSLYCWWEIPWPPSYEGWLGVERALQWWRGPTRLWDSSRRCRTYCKHLILRAL